MQPEFHLPSSDDWSELYHENELGINVILGVAGVFVEPLDWAVTGYDIYSDPYNGWAYAGLIPIIPAGVGRAGRALSDAGSAADDLFEEASSLAGEIAKVGPPQSAQTVCVLETSGGRIAAGGRQDLTELQKLRAAELGADVADDVPGFHAEMTAFLHAAKNSLTPLGGATTNMMCRGEPTACFEQFHRFGYKVIYHQMVKVLS